MMRLSEIKTFKNTSEQGKGDYYIDGRLFCGKCHTAKQVMFGDKLVSCACKCEEAKYFEWQREQKQAQLQFEIDRLRQDGITDEGYSQWTFAADDDSQPALTAKMHKYVDNWQQMKADNIGLLLFGAVGTGKTFFAACIANDLIDKGVPVMMTSFPRLSAAYFENKGVINRTNSYDLLIVDDLGVERQSEYMQEVVYNIIDTRYRAGKPLVVTTNLSLNDLKNAKDIANKRIYDRILEMCLPVAFTGGSKREQKKADKFAAVRDIFKEG